MSQRYILLPQSGLTSDSGPDAERLNALAHAFVHESGSEQKIDGVVLRVHDANRNGPALVEMSEEDAATLARNGSPVRAVAEYVYPHPHAVTLQLAPMPPVAKSAATASVTITCLDAQSGKPLHDADVAAYTDLAARRGDAGRTDAAGKARLHLPAGSLIERLVVDAGPQFWGSCLDDLALQDHTLRIAPLDLAAADVLRHYYPAKDAANRFDPTTGVTVGIVDTGIGPHRDLIFDEQRPEGCCTVTGMPSELFADVSGHGTHVAGVIGGNGGNGAVTPLAPGVKLRAYRVFADATTGATNYAILKAMMQAARDECDIINLSIGGGPPDPGVAEAIQDARNHGMLVIVAAGNDGNPFVSFPAAHENAIAVAAFGRHGTFPAQSTAAAAVRAAPASALDADEFVAAFSNMGERIDVIAPGVGIVSTLPGNRYGALSGTSMAAPVVAGVAACLLSRDRALFAQPRNRARSDALEKKLFASCVKLGFGEPFEGKGRPCA
jgi:subtilisin